MSVPTQIAAEPQMPPPQSPEKSEKQMKREKKKKSAAFQSFLTKPDSSESTPKRKNSDENIILQRSEPTNCKICFNELPERSKMCEFCKQMVCLQHIRKKRKYKNSGKFVRICDECEDKYIYDKYMKLEMKAEESLATQELIISGKHEELKEIIKAKLTKIQLLNNKRKSIEEEFREQEAKFTAQEGELQSKTHRLELKSAEVEETASQVEAMQKSLPPPLESDYNVLVEENNKITRELVKFQKLCNEAIKSKSVREKQMYEDYYAWERRQEERNKEPKKKKEECRIY